MQINCSGIAMICYMFDTRPELKYQKHFSYFSYNKLRTSDLNQNAFPYSPVNTPVSSPKSNVIAYFDKDIINNLMKPPPHQ